MRVTIKSIAKDLGLSHMTVSRALSGHGSVREATRDTVLARARELGYVRNSAANAMRGDPTGIVGLLLPNIVNEFYARFANTLALLCADEGLDLVIHLTDDDAAREHQSLLRLQGLQARSVIYVPVPETHPDTARFAGHMRLIELIRRRAAGDEAGRLMIDDGPAIAAAVDRLADRGRARIAFIGADLSMSSGKARAAAFRTALARRGLAERAELIRTGMPGFAMGRAEMSALLDAPDPPDAVVCGGFEISNGALDACLRARIAMPDALSFVGYGDPAAYRWIAGGITTIALSPEDIAERALAVLVDEHANGERVSPTRLEVRVSA